MRPWTFPHCAEGIDSGKKEEIDRNDNFDRSLFWAEYTTSNEKFIFGCLFKIPQGDFSKPRNPNVTSDLPKISEGTQF